MEFLLLIAVILGSVLFFALPIIVPVVAILVLVVKHFREKKRRNALQLVAARYGLRYNPKDPFSLGRLAFALFRKGHRRRVRDCLDGTYQNLPVVVFGYSYRTGGGLEAETHHVSALLARLDFSGPRLIIRPEGSVESLPDLLGLDDIDFEYEAFNRSFHVEGDKKFAYDICHAEMMQFLMDHPGTSWELGKAWMLLSTPQGGRLQPADVERCLWLAGRFVALTPKYLRAEGRI